MTLREFDYEKEPVVSIVKKILTDAINMKASDIHFDPSTTSLSIKFRINGTLQEYTVAPGEIKTNITTRVKILSNMNITDSMRPQTGTINFEVEGKHHDMRVSSLPICDGEKLVLHVTDYENNIKSLSKMGITPEDTEKIKRLIKNNQGLVLLTGGASSGKTTTMYAMLKEIASKSINIISIEDPVKMKLPGINQVEISPDKGITYKNALKHVMLQDPNIICIDNLIDDEIARDAIRASVTGRLVISSLYTKSAYTTVDTLLSMDIENYLLGSNLNGIISQRLVKQLCPKCKELRRTTEYEKNVIRSILNQEVNELYYPKGCEECHNGYINQIPIVEVVEVTDTIRNAITNKKDSKAIRNLLYKNSNTIIVNGFKKVLEGETTFNEIIRITDVKIDFTEEQNDIKEYILGNGKLTIEQQVIEDVQPTIEETTLVVEETPIIEEPKEVMEEIQQEQMLNNEVQIIEEQPIEQETKKLPTEGQRLIEEINELIGEDIDGYDVIAEMINDNDEQEEQINNEVQVVVENQEEQPAIEEPIQETEEVQAIEETTPVVEETPVVVEEQIVEETTPVIEQTEEPVAEEVQPTIEEATNEESTQVIEEIQQVEETTPIIEEPSETSEEIQEEAIIEEEQQNQKQPIEEEPKEVNVPTPIAANVVDEKPTPAIEEDDEDEDDFGYGEDYENSF